MNRDAEARAILYDAIRDVLPGRVWAYPPPRNGAAAVAPAVWLGQTSGSSTSVGNARFWQVGIPVRIVVDGADHAAYAMLDQLCSAIRDAVTATAGCTPDSYGPDPFDVDGSVTLPGATFDVLVIVEAASFCPPIPESAVFPPQLVGVS